LCHLSESVFEADRARSGFAIAENFSPQRVVVVDYVYTTGAASTAPPWLSTAVDTMFAAHS